MTTNERWPQRAALMVGHCAGMVDLVALPIWVGTLMARYGFDAQQAGALVTLFLAGAVGASSWVAPRFHRLRARRIAPVAYCVAGCAFLACSRLDQFVDLALWHAVGGVAAGTGLSVTHGTVGRTTNPHRLFGLMQTALGVFGVTFLAATPQIVSGLGGSGLFAVFSGVMFVAFPITAIWFPDLEPRGDVACAAANQPVWPRQVWCGIAGIACLALTQAMVFSFLERMGTARGFGVSALNALLVVVGIVNFVPGAMAAALERKFDAHAVMLAGAAAQATLAIVLAWSVSFAAYAAAASVFVSVIIFTCTFAFGLFAKLEPSGRAVAATPAMTMVGSAIGPLLGGTLVKGAGYAALGSAAVLLDFIAFCLFLPLARRATPPQRPAEELSRANTQEGS